MDGCFPWPMLQPWWLPSKPSPRTINNPNAILVPICHPSGTSVHFPIENCILDSLNPGCPFLLQVTFLFMIRRLLEDQERQGNNGAWDLWGSKRTRDRSFVFRPENSEVVMLNSVPMHHSQDHLEAPMPSSWAGFRWSCPVRSHRTKMCKEFQANVSFLSNDIILLSRKLCMVSLVKAVMESSPAHHP